MIMNLTQYDMLIRHCVIKQYIQQGRKTLTFCIVCWEEFSFLVLVFATMSNVPIFISYTKSGIVKIL